MSNKNTTIAKNTIFLSLRMVFVLVVSLYTSRVFLNVLGVVDYGVSNVVAGFVSMFGFLNTSLANGIQRFYNSELGKTGNNGVTRVYNTSIIIQSIIAIIVLLLLETLGLWYLYEKMVIPEGRFNVAFWLFQFSTMSAVIVIMQSPFSAAIMAYERMNYYAFISILDVVLKLVFALSLPSIALDRLLMYGIFYLIVTILNFLLNYVYCKHQFEDITFGKEYNKRMFKDMMSFSGWNLFGTFATMMREQGLNMVLNLFFGPVVNAARGVAYQVSGAMQGFVSNLSLAAKPQMVQSYATGDIDRTMTLMYTMSKLSFIFLFVMSLPVIYNVDYILHLWLGDNVPEHTSAFVILILLASFMNNLNAPLSNVVYATGKMKLYQVTFSILNLIIIPISYMALSYGAPAEAAFAIYFIMTIFVQIACLFVLKSITGLSITHYVLMLCWPIGIISIVETPLIWWLSLNLEKGFLAILVEFFTLTVLSSVLSYYVLLDRSEKQFVITTISKIVKRK